MTREWLLSQSLRDFVHREICWSRQCVTFWYDPIRWSPVQPFLPEGGGKEGVASCRRRAGDRFTEKGHEVRPVGVEVVELGLELEMGRPRPRPTWEWEEELQEDVVREMMERDALKRIE